MLSSNPASRDAASQRSTGKDEEHSMSNRFLAQAQQGRNEIWRYILTILAVITVSFGMQLFIAIIALLAERTLDLTRLSPLALFLVTMASFPFALLALSGGLLLLHKRPLISLLNPSGRIDWRKIIFSGALWFVLSGISDLILALTSPENYHFTFDLAKFLPYLLLGLILIPIQTSTEEFIFRGYLTQWMGRYSKRLWLPWIAPSLVFMLLHSLNPEVGTYGILMTMPVYLGIGLLLGWLTLRSESLELALGLHAANNLYATMIVTFPNSALPSPALFSIGTYQPGTALIVFVVVSVLYLGIMLTVNRKWFFFERGNPNQDVQAGV